MRSPFQLLTRIVDMSGKEFVAMGLDLDPLDFSLQIPKPFLADMREMAFAMKRRNKRREILVYHAGRIGEQFADFLDDADGWNGSEREANTRANWK